MDVALEWSPSIPSDHIWCHVTNEDLINFLTGVVEDITCKNMYFSLGITDRVDFKVLLDPHSDQTQFPESRTLLYQIQNSLHRMRSIDDTFGTTDLKSILVRIKSETLYLRNPSTLLLNDPSTMEGETLFFATTQGLLSKAFCSDFVRNGPFNPVDSIMDHINQEILRERTETDKLLYGPFFSIIQSSGYGKTRGVMQVAKDNVAFVLYARLCHPAGYPSITML